jgi:hypothetical protein
MEQKTFTLKEANRLVPKLKAGFDEIGALKKKIIVLRNEMLWVEEFWGAALRDKDNPDGDMHEKMANEIERMMVEIAKLVQHIERNGCVVRNASDGVVDFYSRVNGKTAFLCWRYGENEIRYWHSLNNGSNKRRSVKRVNVE